MRANFTPEQYYRMVCDRFDALYQESKTGGKVMALPLDPFVMGLPFRIKYLDKALDYIFSHSGGLEDHRVGDCLLDLPSLL